MAPRRRHEKGEMTGPKSIVVCGGGIVGLTCAHFLAKAGHRVVLLERKRRGSGLLRHGSAGLSHAQPYGAAGGAGDDEDGAQANAELPQPVLHEAAASTLASCAGAGCSGGRPPMSGWSARLPSCAISPWRAAIGFRDSRPRRAILSAWSKWVFTISAGPRRGWSTRPRRRSFCASMGWGRRS